MKLPIRKLLIPVLLLIAVSVPLFAQTFNDYANQMRIQIQELKAINQQREDKIASQNITIDELKAVVAQSNEKADKAIKESEEACNALIKQTEQIKRQNKILRIVAIILVIKILGSIALIIIKYKYKIEIPYWLNVIL